MRYFPIFFILSWLVVPGGLRAAEAKQNVSSGSYYEDSAEQKAFARQMSKIVRQGSLINDEFKKLNPDWEIDSVWPLEGGIRRIYAAAMTGQIIYFVTADLCDFKVMSYDGREFKTLIVYPLLRTEKESWGERGLLEIRGDRVLIVLQHHFFFGSLSARTLITPDYLPPDFLGAFIHHDRIFMFAESQLVSFDFNGGDWQVHFSATQDDKMLKEQRAKQRFLITAVGSGPDDDTLWLQSGSTLYQYSVAANALAEMIKLPEYLDNVQAFRHEDQKLYFGGRNGCLIYDTVQRQSTFIALKEELGSLYGQAVFPDRYFTFKRNHDISGLGSFCLIGDWFLADGNDICASLKNSADVQSPSTVFRMSDYPHGPQLRFPSVVKWFPAPGGDGFIAVEFGRITKITYKPQPR